MTNPKYLSAEKVQELAVRSALAYMPGWVHQGRGSANLELFARMVVDEVASFEPAGNPLPPEILADALQDKIHEDTGAVRAGRSVKSNAHICADCGADLSKHPTSAAGHQCPRI